MSLKRCAALAVFALMFLGFAMNVRAVDNPIAPGTVITAQNWRQYKQYMPEGMQLLFAGTYSWKMPADIRIEVGPTSDYPLPQVYRDNTQKYSHRVQLKKLPSGGYQMTGYVAGLPFPNPDEPDKGYKILADSWYRYTPYLFCGNQSRLYLVTGGGQSSGLRIEEVFRRLDHISDIDQPITDPRAEGIDYSQFAMFLEPEQYKYTQILTLFIDNNSEADYLYVPQLRRVLRQSANQRCAPIANSDFTPDDLLGFNGGIVRFQARYLRDQSILELVNSDPRLFGDKANYYSISFPKPILGKWEVRPNYLIDVRRIPSKQAGYCYGKQILYVDQQSYNVSWKEIYSPDMKRVKIHMSEKLALPVPGEGIQFYNGNSIETMWDISNNHMSLFVTAGPGGKGALSANQDCRNLDGVNYDDVKRYSTVGGLTQVMR